MKTNILFLMLPALLLWGAPKAVAAVTTETMTETTEANVKTVSGIFVNAESKEPIQGVTISVKGTTRGTMSDAEGRFEMKVNTGETVLFSYIGYATKEVTIKEIPTDLGTIEMSRDPIQLNEIVVVAFAPKKEEEETPVKSTPQKKENNKNEPVFIVVEKMPEFPGGDEGLLRHIAGKLQYPKEAIKKRIQGVVICKFVVKENGQVGYVKVIQSVDPLLDDEAIRVLYALPAFTPGEQRGKAVPVEFTCPVRFKLPEESE